MTGREGFLKEVGMRNGIIGKGKGRLGKTGRLGTLRVKLGG